MKRLDVWYERHYMALSSWYWRIAWSCLALCFLVSSKFALGAFGFSLSAVVVRYMSSGGKSTLKECSPTSTSPGDSSYSS